ncbi:MAG: NnrU family protein [Gammaproteobacteria bacterium]|jgi:uncharacterized membrane protein
MLLLVAGLILFLGMHSISIVAPAVRDSLAARHGALYRIGYSVVAASGLALIVYGYGQARLDPIVVYTPPPVLRYATLALMILAMPLLVATYLPGRIKAAVRHPMLSAVKAWALAHLFSNGTLADILLFGGFLIWAVADRISLKRRAPRDVPSLPGRPANDIIVVVVGLALVVAFVFGLHTWLIGIPVVLPG